MEINRTPPLYSIVKRRFRDYRIATRLFICNLTGKRREQRERERDGV